MINYVATIKKEDIMNRKSDGINIWAALALLIIAFLTGQVD